MKVTSMKRILSKIIFLALASLQAAPAHAMLVHAARTAVSGTGKRALSRITEQSLLDRHQATDAFPNFSSATVDRKHSYSDKQDTRKLWKLYAGGSIMTALALAASTRKEESSAEEIKNIYGPPFLHSAGFAQGLPYWYLAQFAIKFNDMPLSDHLTMKIELTKMYTYQPDYLSPEELVPVWNGIYWQRDSGNITDMLVNIGGIKISIVNMHEEVVASCSLSAAGMLNFVHVNRISRKGLRLHASFNCKKTCSGSRNL